MAKASSQNTPTGAAPSFETALLELEAIVQKMESGEAPLEESLAAYERGMTLLRHCQETLTAAEQKLQILDGGIARDLCLGDREPEA